ncbi:MAG TPA: hypothetical protein ENN13_04130 [Candidatus Altiarchaeales archaeon]|nr:hypothetical protein [Candidatus Altiarchaeales archaeon]
MIGGLSKSFQKIARKTREMIVQELAVKQKPQLDAEIQKVKLKQARQKIKYFTSVGRGIGKKINSMGVGRSIGKYFWK